MKTECTRPFENEETKRMGEMLLWKISKTEVKEMRIDFDEKNHIYRVNGDIASISVTQLLHKHKLAPDYSGVSKAALKKAATKGKEIHKDIECFINNAVYEPTTEAGKQFREWASKNLDSAIAEQMFAEDFNGMLLAGTADIVGFMQDGTPFIADHKTTAKFDREYVSWQVSLLDYMARKCSGMVINGNAFRWSGAKKFFCFHYTDDGMTVKELTPKTDTEVLALLDAEYHDKLYERHELAVTDDLKDCVAKAESELYRVKAEYDAAKKTADELRAQLVKEMERQGVYSFETDKVKITYVAPYDRTTVDSTKLRREFPSAYAACMKPTTVKASVRVTWRDNENGEED